MGDKKEILRLIDLELEDFIQEEGLCLAKGEKQTLRIAMARGSCLAIAWIQKRLKDGKK